MKTHDDVLKALHRLEREISESVTARDGPRRIMHAVELLIDVKLEIALARFTQAYEKANPDKPKSRMLDIQNEHREIEDHSTNLVGKQ